MARGVPVVAGAAGALPEVAGDAALLVDPESVDEIAAATVSVLTDSALRDRLIAAGRRRPEQFSWDRTAVATLESWRRALASSSR